MTDEQTGTGVAEPLAAADEREAGAARDEGGRGEGTHAPVPKGPPPRGVLREYFESLVVTAVMALFGMTFVVQAVKVPTGSMQNTILIGDHLLVNKFIFAPGPPAFFLPQREIRRGDVIVFKYPGKSKDPQFARYDIRDDAPDNLPFKTNYVKRVIGLPGERVEVRGTQVLIDGRPLAEQRVAALNPPDSDDPRTDGDDKGAPLTDERRVPLTGENAPAPGPSGYNVYWSPRSVRLGEAGGDDAMVFDVPPGHYFVMGDNRENSQDSRHWGYVHRDLVIGRALLVYWSYDESAPSAGNFIQSFLVNTRWRRTGTIVR